MQLSTKELDSPAWAPRMQIIKLEAARAMDGRIDKGAQRKQWKAGHGAHPSGWTKGEKGSDFHEAHGVDWPVMSLIHGGNLL